MILILLFPVPIDFLSFFMRKHEYPNAPPPVPAAPILAPVTTVAESK